MSQAPPAPQAAAAAPQRNAVVLSDIAWSTYTRLLRVFAERPGVRLTYDRGELEIISPLLEHDDDADLLGALVRLLTEELSLPVHGGGSVTLRRRRQKRGLEPDRCYWIATAPQMAGRRRLDLRRDPPPDLAIEADVSHSSLDRMRIYAGLKVPEVWRLETDTLTFHVLGADGKYSAALTSRSFPMVTPADLLGFLQQSRQASDQNTVIRQFREWVRRRFGSAAGSGP